MKAVLAYCRRNIFVPLSLIVILSGTIGYRLIEGYTWLDAFYMTCITVATVGFREVHELSPVGKLFTVGLIVAGLATVVIAISRIGEDLIVVTARKRRERMEKRNKELRNHYILCGYGRMGRVIAEHLKQEHVDFVVVDNRPEIVEAVWEAGGYAICGDATADATLEKAGIQYAKGLVTVLSKDAENVFVVLTASQLNPKLVILTRANNEEAIPKLYRAGATTVINPYESAGARIAQSLLRPAVTDFMRVMSGTRGLEFGVEQVEIQQDSSLAGVTLRDSNIRQATNAMIVAIRKASDQQMIFNPAPETLLEPSDILIAIGNKDALDKLAELARTRA
ncbi:MAG: potassium channel family protein [Candidatus Sumerlaeaceae bacterium]